MNSISLYSINMKYLINTIDATKTKSAKPPSSKKCPKTNQMTKSKPE